MKNKIKPIIALISGQILLACLLCQTVKADESGTAVLADANGVATGPEALTVDYSVTELSDVYTYSYTVNNPSGDVRLSDSQPEIVAAFVVAFNTSIPGAIFNILGGTFSYTSGGGAVVWAFLDPTLAAGDSTTVSFESDYAPVMGDASASDDSPPSPWNTSPDGSPVPVPGVPDTMNTMALLAGMLLLLPVPSILKKKALLSW